MKMATARLDSFERNQVSAHHVWLAPLVLFTITILARLPGLADLPMNDEFYTLLAARGWLLEGEPRIADGLYPRAELFTILTAQFFAALGESFVVARLPALVAGGLLVVLVFVWTRAQAGQLAAWIAALLLARGHRRHWWRRKARTTVTTRTCEVAADGEDEEVRGGYVRHGRWGRLGQRRRLRWRAATTMEDATPLATTAKRARG
jgi:hypothetical protein